MTKSEFKALSKSEKAHFEYTISMADVQGVEYIIWPRKDGTKPYIEYIPTLKGLHLLKHCT